jgi:flagellar protein FliS
MYSQLAYERNLETQVYSASPLELTRMLYRGALDAIRTARRCLDAGDIEGRGKAVNRASAILLELLASLDLQAGGEVAASLSRLYDYAHRRVLAAHLEQQSAPLDEAAALLQTLLEGWEACETDQALNPGQAAPELTSDLSPHLAVQEYGQLSYHY